MSWHGADNKALIPNNGWNSLRGVKGGNPGVFYDGEGRPHYSGREASSFPRDTSQWKTELRPDDYIHYDPTRRSDRTPRSKPYSLESPSSQTKTVITKRYDDYRTGGPIMSTVYRDRDVRETVGGGGGGYVEKYQREGTVILEERIVSHERPWAWPLFLVDGLLLLICGILTLLFCIEDYYYTQIWVPILLFIFAIAGALHRGIYRGSGGRWRNWLYIIMGILTVIGLNFCAAMVLIRLNHVNIQLLEYGPKGPDGFIPEEILRMNRYSLTPQILLNDPELETNIWACYAIDWVTLVLVCIGFGSLSSVVIIGNNYYNSNAVYRREVEPFCRPSLFNPFGQVQLGQAVIFTGMILKTAAHGNYSIRWQDTWAPVWAGIFPVVAGLLAAYALKRVELRWGLVLIILAAVMEFLSFAACGAVIGLIAFGLYEVVDSFDSQTLAVTIFSDGLLTWSVVLFILALGVLVVSVIYSIALFIRLLYEGCCRESSRDTTREKRVRRVYTEEQYPEKYPKYPETREREYAERGAWSEPTFRDDDPPYRFSGGGDRY